MLQVFMELCKVIGPWITLTFLCFQRVDTWCCGSLTSCFLNAQKLTPSESLFTYTGFNRMMFLTHFTFQCKMAEWWKPLPLRVLYRDFIHDKPTCHGVASLYLLVLLVLPHFILFFYYSQSSRYCYKNSCGWKVVRPPYTETQFLLLCDWPLQEWIVFILRENPEKVRCGMGGSLETVAGSD